MSTEPALGSTASPTLNSTTGALSSSSAPAISPLIATAINVASIKTHVPIVLSYKAANYTKWKTYFQAACGKFGLSAHINGTAAKPEDPVWIQADDCVRTWLYNSVADDVIDSAMAPDQHTYDLWRRIGELFTANMNTRAVYLRQQFHSIVQGDLSVNDYMQRIKVIADALRDAGHALKDDELVLNALRGLGPRLRNAADLITFQDPLPDFAKTRDLLSLKELNLDLEQTTASATALVSTTTGSGGSCAGGSACSGSSSRAPNSNNGRGGGSSGGSGSSGGGYGSGNKGRNYNGKGKGRGGGSPFPNRSGASSAPQPPSGPWVCMSWPTAPTGQTWPGAPRYGPSAPGVLGPRPAPAPSQQQAYHTMMAPIQTSSAAGAPQWDQASLIAALNSMQTPSQAWVMDSGATSHMASDDGSSYRGGDSSLQ